eukprot:GHRQ01006586.1.p1 GENE.GHRQ01006586.1~~GHRQ01006586.1.p1  ORF type:complete len:203 (+),score=54.30 GHRQ01006586.1:353-961(+)
MQHAAVHTSSLSPVAARRIQSELKDWGRNPPEGCCLECCEPITQWVVLMAGPEAAAGMPRLYEGEAFRLSIKFTERYPLEPPEVTFLTPTPVHPHIYSNGHICLDILYDGQNGGWSPALTINKLCLSLRSTLASNTEKVRPRTLLVVRLLRTQEVGSAAPCLLAAGITLQQRSMCITFATGVWTVTLATGPYHAVWAHTFAA